RELPPIRHGMLLRPSRARHTMRHCPNCAAPVKPSTTSCWHCGRAYASDDARSPGDAGPLPTLDTPNARELERFSLRSLTAVGIAGVLVTLGTIVVLIWLPLTRREPPVQLVTTRQPSIQPVSDSPVLVDSAPAPTWIGRRQATWARDGSKTIAFELEASNDVPIWMTRARPHLIVRCLSRHTEVFVTLGSAASIEPQANSHTVRLQIDGDAELVQQ